MNLLKNLRHPGIPIIYDLEEDERVLYLVEEYVQGSTLAALVQSNGTFGAKRACEIIEELCGILDYLHHLEPLAIIHLDLKPENIMIDLCGSVKLIDFGNAAIVRNGVKHCAGTAGFAAPEQYHRLKPDARSDIYGVGMLAAWMLTGHQSDAGISKIPSNELSTIIKKCIRHNPLRRYANAAQLKREIHKVYCRYEEEDSDDSLTIHLIGIKNGIGTTHIALALTAWLTSHHLDAVYCDITGTDGIYDLIRCRAAVITDRGTYAMSGIQALPDFDGAVAVQENWQVTVRDCGTAFAEYHDQAKHMNIFVGCAKEQEANAFEQRVAQLLTRAAEYDSESINVCILNHMSGRQFYSYVRRSKSNLMSFRMPCQYCWDTPDKLTEETFEELFDSTMPGFIPKAQRGRLCWGIDIDSIKRIFRMDTRSRQKG